MKRGDLITVALPGAGHKPRPGVVVQSNQFSDRASVTFLPLSSDILPAVIFRMTIDPSRENGLAKQSQVLADKCSTLPPNRIGAVFGRLNPADLNRADHALALFLGFG